MLWNTPTWDPSGQLVVNLCNIYISAGEDWTGVPGDLPWHTDTSRQNVRRQEVYFHRVRSKRKCRTAVSWSPRLHHLTANAACRQNSFTSGMGWWCTDAGVKRGEKVRTEDDRRMTRGRQENVRISRLQREADQASPGGRGQGSTSK